MADFKLCASGDPAGALLDYAKILDSELARLSQLNVNISVVH